MQESGEMYLETIFLLKDLKSNVRSIDIAETMNYSKASVSRAVNILKNEGFITTDKDGFISLTTEGNEIAKKIVERHVLLTQFLVSIGVSRETAATDACKIEHIISEESFEKIKELVNKE